MATGAMAPTSRGEREPLQRRKAPDRPYAKAIAGQVNWDAPVHGYDVRRKGDDRDLRLDWQDDALGNARGVVVDESFDWLGDRRPNTPWHDTIIYETTSRHLLQTSEVQRNSRDFTPASPPGDRPTI